MYTLKIQNQRGELYELTHDREHYTVMKISGLTLPHCNVNTSSAGMQDGEEYNSSHLEKRNLVITLALEGDIESSRQQLYRIFPLHSPVRVFFKNRNRDVTIDGYVETIDGDLFATREMMQISLICPNPFWEDLNGIQQQFGKETVSFSFPFSIPESGTVISGVYKNPAHEIANNGTSSVGFVADISINAEGTTTLAEAKTQSDTPENLRARTARLVDQSFIYIDQTSETVNIFVDGSLKTPGTDYGIEYLIRGDSQPWKDIWIDCPDGNLTNATVTVENIKVFDQNETLVPVTDMRYWIAPTTFTNYQTITVEGVPSWFDKTKDRVFCNRTDGNHALVPISGMTVTQGAGDTFSLQITFSVYDSDKSVDCKIYGSVSKVDVHDAVIRRYTYSFALGAFTDSILDPTLPTYDSTKDILRLYMGDTLLDSTAYSFETVTKSDSTTSVLLIVPQMIAKKITYYVVSSKSGEDIRAYTQAQIDDGLLLVDGLTLTNFTTGEIIAFPDISFRDGDAFTVSTISGDLYATVTASAWMPEGKSLIYEIMRHGTFFDLIPGENVLGFTADSHPEFISCSLRAKQLYGGV